MLQFIYGVPSSGKTFLALETIKRLSIEKKQVVLIVPEQFSFESEKAVLKKLGDGDALNVAVMSFSRLCEEIGRNIGGIAGVTLGDADKVIFMNKALNSVTSELVLWARYTHSVSFAKTMLDIVGEFKINAVTPDELRQACENTESQSLKNKIHDIILIFEAYDALVGERFIDPADKLTKLYRSLEDYHYFENKTVIIDSFKGFTGQQFKIIDRILSQAENVFVSLTNNPAFVKEYNIYSNIRAAAERIKKSARRYKVGEEPPVILNESRYNSGSLSVLEKLMAGEKAEYPENDVAITVCSASSVYDEAEFAARTIRQLVRTEGYRYRDCVIIARDAERYEDAVISACIKNNISCFADRRIPLAAFPLSVAVNAAIETAIRMSTENILRFHKTGLGTLDYDEISRLENYAALWNINGDMWNKPWDMDVRGFVSDGENDEKSDKELEKINALREKAIAPINSFVENFGSNARKMSSAIVNMLEQCSSAKSLAAMCNTFESSDGQFSSDVLKQSYDVYMKLLDSMVNCFGDRTIRKQEFFDALSLAVSFETIGVIPRMLDEVTFGAADRIRPSRPKVAFILGANQGVFPKNISDTGIFPANERKSLIELGLEIADNSISSSIDEEYLVYCNLCCPSDKLYISYSSHSTAGDAFEPSAFVLSIQDKIGCSIVSEPEESITSDNIPETADSAFSEYCRRVGVSINDAAVLKSGLKETRTYEKISYIDNCMSGETKSVSKDISAELFGKNIKMSATRFDTFHRCRFSFFCKYGLGTKKIQPADFDVLQRGTMVHYVLEKIISKYKKDISKLDRATLDELTENYIHEYLDGVTGYKTVETSKSRFLISRISRSLKEVVWHIACEFAQSGFEPVSCELKIGDGGQLPALQLPFDDGNISLVGSIDRVDEYNGYIRIIDYKTGSKSFKLPDILFGLNLQMLIYLYAVIRAQGKADEKAAGILYMPSKRDLSDSGMAMNGVVQSDAELVQAMEKDNNGEFIPKLSFLKDGSIAKRCTSFIAAEDFGNIFDYIEKLMRDTGNKITSGDIAISPIDGRESPACKYCDYGAICGIENTPIMRVPDYKNEEVFKKMKEGGADGI